MSTRATNYLAALGILLLLAVVVFWAVRSAGADDARVEQADREAEMHADSAAFYRERARADSLRADSLAAVLAERDRQHAAAVADAQAAIDQWRQAASRRVVALPSDPDTIPPDTTDLVSAGNELARTCSIVIRTCAERAEASEALAGARAGELDAVRQELRHTQAVADAYRRMIPSTWDGIRRGGLTGLCASGGGALGAAVDDVRGAAAGAGLAAVVCFVAGG